jgi:hypothetical protein
MSLSNVIKLLNYVFNLGTQNIFTKYFSVKKHVQFWCERLIMKWGGVERHLNVQLFALATLQRDGSG